MGRAGSNFDLKNRWEPNAKVLEQLKGSFFYSIAQLKPYKQCHIFQDFIQECYNKNTKTFSFGRNNDVELYFGLQDVYALSGMPVDGRPIVCDDIETEKLCRQYLGTFDESACKSKKSAGKSKKVSSMKVSREWLRKNFKNVPDEATNETLQYHVRAYLLYLIGTVILPDNDNPREYPAYWLQFIKDLNPRKLDGVAWGAAAHCMLTNTFTKKRNYVHGPWWLYELFFLERIPKIRDTFLGVGSSSESVKDIPLHKYWCLRIANRGNQKSGKSAFRQALKDIRSSMTANDILLEPYADYPAYYDQRIFFSRVVLFNFGDLVYHEPQNGYKQLSIKELKKLDPQSPLKTMLPRGTTQRYYRRRYAKYIEMWNEKRHSDDICIKCKGACFELPLEPDEEEESEGDGSFEHSFELDEEEESEDMTNMRENVDTNASTFNDSVKVTVKHKKSIAKKRKFVSNKSSINDGDSETSYAFSEPVMHGKKFVSNKSSINDGDSETSYAFSEPVMHGNYSPANNEEMPGDETTDKDERPNDKQKQNPSGPHNDPMTKETTDKDERPNDKQKQNPSGPHNDPMMKETTDKDERPNDKQKQIYACTLVDVPQQTGCDDCGIYVCRSMEFPDDVMRFKKEEWKSEEERCCLAVRILRAQENSITRNNIDQVYSRRKNRVKSSAAERTSLTHF